MSIQIKLKNSVVQDSTPSTSDLPAVGELALNANINSIGGFMRASDNTIVKIFGPGSVTTPTATTTVSGISELATNSETTTGTATNRVVTPAGLNAVTTAERTTSNTNYVAKAGSTLTGVLTMPNGSNSAPAINFGDSDSGIFGGTNTVSLTAGGTTRLTADTGVSVVGTLAVTGAITSTSDLTIADKIIHAGDTDTAVRFPSGNTISFETGGTEKFRVDGEGHVSVGTSTSRTVGGAVERIFQVEGADGSAGISIIRNSNSSSPPVLSFGKQRSGSSGGNTIVQDDDQLGQVHFAGADGTDVNTSAASIAAFVDGTPGANDMPGRLVFSTTADGANSPTTRLTIDSTGLVKLPDNGKFVAGAGNDLQISHDSSIGQNILQASAITRFRTNSLFSFQNSDGSEAILKGTPDAAVELFYDGSKKFETTSAGATLNGDLTITDDLFLQDNLLMGDGDKIAMGDGEDLQIYHDGSHSYIANTTGNLYITEDGYIELSSANGGEKYATFNKDAAVELYYDNSKKFETTSTGVSFNDGNISNVGSIALDSIKGDADDNTNITFATNDVITFKCGSTSPALTVNTTQVKVEDNQKFVAGTGNDLEIYHNGSNSYIDNGTGNLYFRGSNGQMLFRPNNNEDALVLKPNGAVELYYDNSLKLDTRSSGVGISGNLFLVDSDVIYIGSSNDMSLSHDGSNSHIYNGTGNLQIRSANNLQLQTHDNEMHIKCIEDGAVELYHNGSKKFETTSSGGLVTGQLLASSGFKVNDGVHITLGTDNDFKLYHDGSNAAWLNTTGNNYLYGSGGNFFIRPVNGESSIDAIANGAVKLYYDNSKKLETQSGGITVNGNANFGDNKKTVFGDGSDLKIYSNGTAGYIDHVTTGTGADLILRSKTVIIRNLSNENMLVGNQNAAVELYYDNSKKLETTTNGIQMTGDIRFNNSTWTGETTDGKIQTHGNHMYFQTAGSSWFFRKNDGTTAASINNAGAYSQVSDSTFKKDIVTIKNPVDTIKKLIGRSFTWKEDNAKSFGVIAQEVETILPELVFSTEEPKGSTVEPKKMVNYPAFTGHFIEAIKELATKIETLESEIAELKAA